MYDIFEQKKEKKYLKQPWMDTKRFVLGTVDNLAQIVDECIHKTGRYACDLETSGVDNRVVEMGGHLRTVDYVAGMGLCPDGETAYYIPVRHVLSNGDPHPANVPLDVFIREIKRLVKATDDGETVAIFHNGKFDHEFLQFFDNGECLGEWDKPKQWHDTLILCYLRNSRARDKKLKHVSRQPRDMKKEEWSTNPCGGPGLGMEMIDLYELWGHEQEDKNFVYDFSSLDPTTEEVLWYGGGDVICTYLLLDVLLPVVTDPDEDGFNQSLIYSIEKSVVPAERMMERSQIHVDLDHVQRLIAIGHNEWKEAVQEVYKHASDILGRDVMPGTFRILFEEFVADNPRLLLNEQIERAEKMAKPLYGAKVGKFKKNGKEFQDTYDIMSNPQLGVMFDEMNVPNLRFTEKSGQVMTAREELDRVIAEAGDKFPFMSKISRFREVSRALSSYLYHMINDIEPTDEVGHGGFMRVSFNGRKIDSGRYSVAASEQGKRMIGFPKVQFQAIPRTDLDPKHPRPECMRRIREVVTARPVKPGQVKRVLAAIDFSGEELRLVTNLSGEQKWVNEFYRCSACSRTFPQEPRSSECRTPNAPPPRCPNCGSDKIGDIHTLTALEIYGHDAQARDDWKVLRTNCKGVNFGLCYGGGPQAVMHAVGCDKQEGQRVKTKFDDSYKGLQLWWAKTKSYARKYCFIRTPFGRKYPLPDIKASENWMVAKAERNAVNGPIQGAGADIIKIAMALLYKEFKKRGWIGVVHMIATMHDELVFDIPMDILEEVTGVIAQTMTSNPIVLSQNWIVPLTCDVEYGYDWSVPWDLNGMRHKETRFIGNKKIKSKKVCPEGFDFDSLPHWPEDLVPWFKDSGQSQTSNVVQTQVETAVIHRPEPVVSSPPATQDTPPATGISLQYHNTSSLIPTPVQDGELVVTLKVPLTVTNSVKLANAFAQSIGRGTTRVRVLSQSGEEIPIHTKFASVNDKIPLTVNAREFFVRVYEMVTH